MENNAMQGSPQGAAGTATRYAEKLGEQASSSANRIADAGHQMLDRASEAAASAADALSARSQEWARMQEQYMETTRNYVRENPLAAVGIALAIGVLLARLTRH